MYEEKMYDYALTENEKISKWLQGLYDNSDQVVSSADIFWFENWESVQTEVTTLKYGTVDPRDSILNRQEFY